MSCQTLLIESYETEEEDEPTFSAKCKINLTCAITGASEIRKVEVRTRKTQNPLTVPNQNEAPHQTVRNLDLYPLGNCHSQSEWSMENEQHQMPKSSEHFQIRMKTAK
jgi:hypothetical protein